MIFIKFLGYSRTYGTLGVMLVTALAACSTANDSAPEDVASTSSSASSPVEGGPGSDGPTESPPAISASAPLGSGTAGSLPPLDPSAPGQVLSFATGDTEAVTRWCEGFDYKVFEDVFPTEEGSWFVNGFFNPDGLWVTCIFRRGGMTLDAAGNPSNHTGAVRIDLYDSGVALTGEHGGIAIHPTDEGCTSQAIDTHVERNQVAAGACRADDVGIGVLTFQEGEFERPGEALKESVAMVRDINTRLGPYPWGGE